MGLVLLSTKIQKDSEKGPDFKGFSVLKACSWAWKCLWLRAAASGVSSICCDSELGWLSFAGLQFC